MDVFNGTFGVCNDSGSGASDMANQCGVCGKYFGNYSGGIMLCLRDFKKEH